MKRDMYPRREFLGTSSAVAAGLFAAAASTKCQAWSANEALQYAAIGVGIRGSGINCDAAHFAQCIAICDVDSNHIEKANAKLASSLQSKSRSAMNPESVSDYREVINRDDIDFVVIATPDHWHAKIAIEAMLAGKDVYCEKPMTLTIDEGRQLVDIQKRTGRVFQVGTQQRSDARFQKAVALQREGRVGQLTRVTCGLGGAPKSKVLPIAEVPRGLDWDRWLGPAPMVDYRQAGQPAQFGYGKEFPHGRGHAHFRWWYEYSGGKLTDWGAHHVDIAMWAMDKSDSTIGPFTIEPLMVEHPVEFSEGMPLSDDQFNTATAFHLRVTFKDGIELDIRHSANDDLGFGNGIMFQGDAGRYFVNRSKLTGRPVEQLDSSPLATDTFEAIHPGLLGNGMWHMDDFIKCVRSRKTPVSDLVSHHRHLTVCHAANIAMRLGRKLTYDPLSETFVDDSNANAFLARQPRAGYETKS
ncbi:MAG: Gfo/Idh/MocA family oxidoreductase [Planctomycetota bacterium]